MLLRYARIYPFYFSTMAFNGDYQQLATALLVQAGVAGAAGGHWWWCVIVFLLSAKCQYNSTDLVSALHLLPL